MVLAVAAVAALAAPAAAQAGSISGTVTGTGNAPLEGVCVGAIGNPFVETTTNASGQYTLDAGSPAPTACVSRPAPRATST